MLLTETEDGENGLRQDPVPQGLPSTTRPPPTNLLQQFISNPLQSIQTAFAGQSSPAPLEDGATQPPSIFQQGLTSVQQGLQGIQNNLQNQLQGLQSSLSSALNLPSTQAETLTGEVTSARPPFNPIQSIQSALSNLLPQPAATTQQEGGQQPVSQGPLSGILNLFSPTRAPTTYSPQPTPAPLLTSVAPAPLVTENKTPAKDQVSFDSVESSEESGEITVDRKTDKEEEQTTDQKETKVPEKEQLDEDKKKE